MVGRLPRFSKKRGPDPRDPPSATLLHLNHLYIPSILRCRFCPCVPDSSCQVSSARPVLPLWLWRTLCGRSRIIFSTTEDSASRLLQRQPSGELLELPRATAAAVAAGHRPGHVATPRRSQSTGQEPKVRSHLQSQLQLAFTRHCRRVELSRGVTFSDWTWRRRGDVETQRRGGDAETGEGRTRRPTGRDRDGPGRTGCEQMARQRRPVRRDGDTGLSPIT